MTEKLKGIVERIHDEQKEGQYGEYTKRGVLIRGKWYNGNVKKKTWDDFKQGDEVLLELERNGEYLNIVKATNLSDSVARPEDLSDAPKPSKTSQNKDFTPASALPRPPPSKEEINRWDAKDMLIVRQNALTHADNHINRLVVQGQKPTEKEYFDFAQRCVDWVYDKPKPKPKPEQKLEPEVGDAVKAKKNGATQ